MRPLASWLYIFPFRVFNLLFCDGLLVAAGFGRLSPDLSGRLRVGLYLLKLNVFAHIGVYLLAPARGLLRGLLFLPTRAALPSTAAEEVAHLFARFIHKQAGPQQWPYYKYEKEKE